MRKKKRCKKEQERYWTRCFKNNKEFIVGFTEEFFFYDSIIGKVWIREDERHVVRITRSHQELVLFCATSLEGRQLLV